MHALTVVLLAVAAADGEGVSERPYWDKCRTIYTRTAYAPVYFDAPLYSGYVPPAGGGSSRGTAPSTSPSLNMGSGGGGGSGHPEALLMLAVIAAAALPFIIYAVDSDADGLTIDRFYCPEFSFSALAGVQAGTRPGESAVGIGIAKFKTTVGYVGVQAQVDIAPTYLPYGAWSAHFLARVKPKKHIEGGLAIGGRRAVGPGGVLDGFEVGLPHQYVFFRDGYKNYGLEVMPRIFWNKRGLDAGVEIAFVIPVADILQLRAGVSVFSHASLTQVAGSTGLTLNL